MMNQSKNNPHRIARRAGYQGARAPTRNQAGIEKCTTGTTTSHHRTPVSPQTEVTPQIGPQDVSSNLKTAKRTKWTREEYKQVV